ncbi:hypothetical protein ANO14919_045020 [Xylariales sp. No.14919]|nr:hypothetical protein ANO14919_045020 [Xylariales sp. No.14919]
MEALAVLGAVVNIAQALEYGFRLLQMSKSLRRFGVVDPNLNDDVWRLKNTTITLSSQELPRGHDNLRNLAVKCAEVSGELISELEELKPTNPKSKRQRVKTIYKSERRRSRINKLRKRLNEYETQLGRHLASVARIESNMKLDEIGQDVHKMASELAAMQFVLKGLGDSRHISQEISNAVQSLVQNHHGHVGQSSEQAILDKLHFPNMHERFDIVVDAHRETLRWLFNSTGGDGGLKEKAGKDFVAWLRQGSGFFHISGKPGAGKSTMMKYICEHKDLDDHLNVWCQGAQLGRGQFFFWMPGTAEQKNLKGLLRGLLHSILDQNRDLIPTALPDIWEAMFANPPYSRELEYRDFQQGFDNILKYASESRLYKFVLFIDGLDEFEGRHLDLITTMKQWTEKYFSVLKICVSSREYMVFQQSFSPYPKLRLHEYTFTDIGRMVSAHLKSKPEYVDVFTSAESQTIIALITERAEGVFLWVSIVLSSIEDALMSGASFRELKEKIEAYPTELDPLYCHLVRLIHETDRRWAFKALKTVQFFQTQKEFTPEMAPLRLGLLELSFLEDVQHGDAATTAFASASTLEPEAAIKRLDNTYKKVYGRCKGFLHVLVSNTEVETPPTMRQKVIFIHRSIVEFLETPSFAELAWPYLRDFDCFDNACGALLKCIDYQRPIPDVFCDCKSRQERDFYCLCTVRQKRTINLFWARTIRQYIRLAASLRRIDSSTFQCHVEAFREAILTLSEKLEDRKPLSESVNRYFAVNGLTVGLSEPLERMLDTNQQPDSSLFSDSEGGIGYQDFNEIGYEEHWLHITQDRFVKTLSTILQLGRKITSPAEHFLWWERQWDRIISGFMTNQFPQSWCPGAIIDWCLRHEADPGLTFGELIPSGPHSLPWLNPKDGWQLVSLRDFSFSDFQVTRLGNVDYLFITTNTSQNS